MDIIERRQILETRDTPDGRLDYIASLKGTLQAFGHGKPTHISIHYVPDRVIVDPDAFGRYLEALAALDWESLEELATAVLGDFVDPLVGRWVRVVAMRRKALIPVSAPMRSRSRTASPIGAILACCPG